MEEHAHRVGDDADHGLRAVASTGVSQGGHDGSVGVEQIVTGHAWLKHKRHWDGAPPQVSDELQTSKGVGRESRKPIYESFHLELKFKSIMNTSWNQVVCPSEAGPYQASWELQQGWQPPDSPAVQHPAGQHPCNLAKESHLFKGGIWTNGALILSRHLW